MQGFEDRVALEWLILADGAQIANNKLFLLGGGWEVLTVNAGFPITQHLAIAAAFRVPWVATNQRHAFEIRIENDDTNEQLAGIAGEFETGRPPGIPAGSAQRSQLAGELLVEFKSPGLYVVRCALEGEDQADKRLPFRVIAGPLLSQKAAH